MELQTQPMWLGGALQVYLITGGALNVKKDLVKQVKGLKKSYLKFYGKFASLLASQHDYTVAVYSVRTST